MSDHNSSRTKKHRRRIPRRALKFARLQAAAMFSITLATIAAVISLAALGATSTDASNPHWTQAGCTACHASEDGQLKPVPLSAIDALCLSCHDGQKTVAERHPIGRSFTGEAIRQPESWPAPDGKLGCVTCHEIVRACKNAHGRPGANPEFLRAFNPARPLAFCANCHVETQHARYNPHQMLDSNQAVVERACLHCHEQALPHDPCSRTGSPRLRSPEPTLCLACHSMHVDYFDPGHLGSTPTPSIAARLRGLQQNRGARDLRSPLLPLDPQQRIVCSTCHNPHQRGVFTEACVLAAGAGDFTSDQRELALRRPSKEFCASCHGW